MHDSLATPRAIFLTVLTPRNYAFTARKLLTPNVCVFFKRSGVRLLMQPLGKDQQIVVNTLRRIRFNSADLSERKPLRNGRSASASYRRHHKGIRGGWASRAMSAFKKTLYCPRAAKWTNRSRLRSMPYRVGGLVCANTMLTKRAVMLEWEEQVT